MKIISVSKIGFNEQTKDVVLAVATDTGQVETLPFSREAAHLAGKLLMANRVPQTSDTATDLHPIVAHAVSPATLENGQAGLIVRIDEAHCIVFALPHESLDSLTYHLNQRMESRARPQ